MLVKQGRKYDIPFQMLQCLINSGLKVRDISELLNVSKRTVERRMEEYNLSVRQTYSNLSDEKIKLEVQQLSASFPNVGYRTIQSLLLSKGLKIQEHKVRHALRECDPCGVLFCRVFLTSSRIQRRTYSVSGPQALWHIDGNHKLIRWRLVIHGGVDGFSRFPVFLKVSNNNSAQTVLCAFLEAVNKFGKPARVRSDKGGENVLVAEYMLQHQQSVDRPFIAGRSVHNQRIQAHLDRFTEALRRRPLRTENNRTPLQLWLTSNHATSMDQDSTNDYGIDYNPGALITHPESVVVPDSMEITENQKQQLQHILQKDSNNFGVDIYQEILEYWTVNNL
ncbi:uncharacterized protein LOC123533407 isoform X3 [Mercenaria mercenaria]|uniref:uncharacterized protein LOC123533407 isoform X3 n=1 Tax=Mercenaria mercenaria TaxID=6596 RepID=UPI00234F69F4|nr:uncharacterized protein LOC123533407 isoform X3 [Mercenaria mercenaria]